jgi:hypothetical protein
MAAGGRDTRNVAFQVTRTLRQTEIQKVGMLSLELPLVATGSPQFELEQQSLAANPGARPFLVGRERPAFLVCFNK